MPSLPPSCSKSLTSSKDTSHFSSSLSSSKFKPFSNSHSSSSLFSVNINIKESHSKRKKDKISASIPTTADNPFLTKVGSTLNNEKVHSQKKPLQETVASFSSFPTSSTSSCFLMSSPSTSLVHSEMDSSSLQNFQNLSTSNLNPSPLLSHPSSSPSSSLSDTSSTSLVSITTSLSSSELNPSPLSPSPSPQPPLCSSPMIPPIPTLTQVSHLRPPPPLPPNSLFPLPVTEHKVYTPKKKFKLDLAKLSSSSVPSSSSPTSSTSSTSSIPFTLTKPLLSSPTTLNTTATQSATPDHSPNLAPSEARSPPSSLPVSSSSLVSIIHSIDIIKQFPKKYSPCFFHSPHSFLLSFPFLLKLNIHQLAVYQRFFPLHQIKYHINFVIFCAPFQGNLKLTQQNKKKRFTTTDTSLPSPDSVDLIYCAKVYKETFSLLRPNRITKSGMPSVENEYDPISDLIDTVCQLVEHTIVCAPESVSRMFLDEKQGILRQLERSRNRKNLTEFVAAVDAFNKEYARCKKEGYVIGYHKKRLKTATEVERKTILNMVGSFTPFSLVSHLLYQAYARAVAPKADLLQKYKAFSDTVYGEINPNFVELILQHVHLTPDDVFIDLGSGIGNVVMHVAARTECQAYGIEIQENVSKLAEAYVDEFKARMKFFNRRMGPIQLEQGDFLTHPLIPKLLTKAKVIFVNNYVFSPELNRNLLNLFLDLNEQAMIVSLKAFASPDLRISSRNMHSVEALLDVKVFEFGTGYVSWTDHGGKFYIQTMDRQRIRKFANKLGRKNFY